MKDMSTIEESLSSPSSPPSPIKTYSIKIPKGLRFVLNDLTREIICHLSSQEMPDLKEEIILKYCADFLERKLEERQQKFAEDESDYSIGSFNNRRPEMLDAETWTTTSIDDDEDVAAKSDTKSIKEAIFDSDSGFETTTTGPCASALSQSLAPSTTGASFLENPSDNADVASLESALENLASASVFHQQQETFDKFSKEDNDRQSNREENSKDLHRLNLEFKLVGDNEEKTQQLTRIGLLVSETKVDVVTAHGIVDDVLDKICKTSTVPIQLFSGGGPKISAKADDDVTSPDEDHLGNNHCRKVLNKTDFQWPPLLIGEEEQLEHYHLQQVVQTSETISPIKVSLPTLKSCCYDDDDAIVDHTKAFSKNLKDELNESPIEQNLVAKAKVEFHTQTSFSTPSVSCQTELNNSNQQNEESFSNYSNVTNDLTNKLQDDLVARVLLEHVGTVFRTPDPRRRAVNYLDLSNLGEEGETPASDEIWLAVEDEGAEEHKGFLSSSTEDDARSDSTIETDKLSTTAAMAGHPGDGGLVKADLSKRSRRPRGADFQSREETNEVTSRLQGVIAEELTPIQDTLNITEQSVFNLTDKLHKMETALSDLIHLVAKSPDVVNSMDPDKTEDRRHSIHSIVAKIDSLSSDMSSIETVNLLRKDNDILRRDLETYRERERKLLSRIDEMELKVKRLAISGSLSSNESSFSRSDSQESTTHVVDSQNNSKSSEKIGGTKSNKKLSRRPSLSRNKFSEEKIAKSEVQIIRSDNAILRQDLQVLRERETELERRNVDLENKLLRHRQQAKLLDLKFNPVESKHFVVDDDDDNSNCLVHKVVDSATIPPQTPATTKSKSKALKIDPPLREELNKTLTNDDFTSAGDATTSSPAAAVDGNDQCFIEPIPNNIKTTKENLISKELPEIIESQESAETSKIKISESMSDLATISQTENTLNKKSVSYDSEDWRVTITSNKQDLELTANSPRNFVVTPRSNSNQPKTPPPKPQPLPAKTQPVIKSELKKPKKIPKPLPPKPKLAKKERKPLPVKVTANKKQLKDIPAPVKKPILKDSRYDFGPPIPGQYPPRDLDYIHGRIPTYKLHISTTTQVGDIISQKDVPASPSCSVQTSLTSSIDSGVSQITTLDDHHPFKNDIHDRSTAQESCQVPK